MEVQNHCDACGLCEEADQALGSEMCKTKMAGKFMNGEWHNGIEWAALDGGGRVLTKSTFHWSEHQKRTSKKNTNTIIATADNFSEAHHEILIEWSKDISGFKKPGLMDKYIQYMNTNPFSLILDFRVNEEIIGYSWLVILDDMIIHQLFPWRKKLYSYLSLGVYEKEALLKLWPGQYHFMGKDYDFKQKFGGWTYDGQVVLHSVNESTNLVKQ